MKRKKLPSISSRKKLAWSLLSKLIRYHNSDHRGIVECVTCGKQIHYSEAHAGHFVPRARGIACYFEWRNIHCQCRGCNFFGGEMVKIRYSQWMVKMYGQDEVDRLVTLSQTTVHLTRADYEGMIEHYRRCLDEI